MLMKVSVSWMRIYKDKSVWIPRNRNKIKMHVREIKTAGMHAISFAGGEAGAALLPGTYNDPYPLFLVLSR